MHYPASTNHDDPPADRDPSAAEGARSPTDLPSRSDRRPRDLVISLLVLLAPVLVLVGGYQVLAGRDEPVRVSPDAEIAAARRAGMQVLVPAGLDPAWAPVSAAFRQDGGRATLRLGYLTPQGRPVQIVQSSVPPVDLIARELARDPATAGMVTVDGVEWQRYQGRDGETALVRHDPPRTVLVVGPATEPELRELAGALR